MCAHNDTSFLFNQFTTLLRYFKLSSACLKSSEFVQSSSLTCEKHNFNGKYQLLNGFSISAVEYYCAFFTVTNIFCSVLLLKDSVRPDSDCWWQLRVVILQIIELNINKTL